MGMDYAVLQVTSTQEGIQLALAVCEDAADLKSEEIVASVHLKGKDAWLRVEVQDGGICRFAYSENGTGFTPVGEPFKAREGKWIGAKVGLFAVTAQPTGLHGYAVFDYFSIKKYEI